MRNIMETSSFDVAKIRKKNCLNQRSLVLGMGVGWASWKYCHRARTHKGVGRASN